MTVWGGLTFPEMMILQSYFMVMIFIFEIPSGAIADYIGRRTALSLSAVCVILAAFTYSIIPNIAVFFLAETFWALGIALFSGTDEAFLYSTLKTTDEEEKLPKVLGRTKTFSLLANVISAPLGSIIAEFISLQFTMTCLGLIYIGSFITSLTFKEPVFEKKVKKKYFHILQEGFKELKKNKTLRILCFDRLFINILIFLLFWTYQPYLIAINVSVLYLGFILAGMNVVNAIFNELIPKIFKRVKSKKLLLIIIDVITGIAFILMGFTTYYPFGIILLLFIVGFGYPRQLLYINGINRQIETENRATVISTINMFKSISNAILYPFIGLIVEEWNIFALFVIVGVLILLFTSLTRIKNEYL